MRTMTKYHSDVTRQIHHAAIVVSDIRTSMAFYCEGIGLAPLADETFNGPWRDLFGGPDSPLRSIFLGDPLYPNAGLVELIHFESQIQPTPIVQDARYGFLMLSFWVDVPVTVDRLSRSGLGSDLKVIVIDDASIARVRDPDGVLIELIPRVLS